MIVAYIEPFIDAKDELYPLFELNNAEMSFDNEFEFLDPNYDQYKSVEDNDRLMFVALRCSGKLIGYLTGFIHPSFHRKGLVQCTVDLFYVHPDYRGNGGLEIMISKAESYLKEKNVDNWYVGVRPTRCKYAGDKLNELGFVPGELYFYKGLEV